MTVAEAPVVPDAPTELSPTPEAVQGEQPQGQPSGEQSTVQGEQPQGRQDSAAQGLFDLGDIADPAVRSQVERIAKEIERNANKRFQEHAEYRKNWEPFEEMGVGDLDPEGVAAMLDFFQRLSNPDTAHGALNELVDLVGLDSGEAEDGAEDTAGELPDEVQELIAWKREQDAQQVESQIREEERQRLTAEWDEVTRKHGKPLDGDLAERVKNLATRFLADPSIEQPIHAAYDFISEVSGSAEQQLVAATPDPPARAEGKGSASTAIKPPETFEEAEKALRERRRALTP